MVVLADQIVSDQLRIVRAETLKALEFQFDEFAADFDLWRAARRKNEVADMRARLEHRGDELRGLDAPLSCWSLRCGTHEIFAVSVE